MSFTKVKESDNYITNKEEWEKIQNYLPKDKIIWSPFYCDGKQKQYFKEMGHDIIHEDKDFFSYEPDNWGMVVDNPPFSCKKQVLERLKQLGKPFILIAPSMMIGYKYFQELFKDEIQILVPQKRICYTHLNQANRTEKEKYTPPFCSFFYCWKMNLPRDIIFV